MTRLNRIAVLALGLAALSIGRPAASQLASRTTEEWIKTLDAPARVAAMRADDVVAHLRLREGQIVADLGAGTGAFSLPLAKAVGLSGKVYAIEIDKGLVEYIARKVSDSGVTNVEARLGVPTDPHLPTNVDVAFLHDVLHHVSDRASYLKTAARYVKPGGRFVIIDPDPALGPHKADPALVVSKSQANEWMKAAGFVPQDDVAMFTDRWFVVYQRP
jgi:ubiquinone/menaquinone biosynthesis C-methylase UbiE